MSPEPAAPRPFEGMARILMVAKERSYQHTLRRQLVRQGFVVDVVATTDEAGLRCARSHYDVVLMDLTATGAGGFALCRTLQADDESPMVMMLAPPDGAEERLAGFEAGAADCVSKPVLGREIAARLRALTRRRGSPGLQTAR
jgi:DNA-binding response OmpR family regulator